MPPPKKLDLIPIELRQRLAMVLQERGFGDIVDVTEDLNFWLQEAGLEIRIGKTSVGEFSKLLKDQRDAFAMAETLLGDLDIEAESNMHKVLMQMIATAAFQMMQAVSEQDGHFEPKQLANLSRMLKDLMLSAGIREKLRDDERDRVAKEAREAAAEEVGAAAAQLGLTGETVESIKDKILFGSG
ncbi:DUF3486 family protein [Rhodobacteraceae bacterium M382]|nr:DUF3486 family protein [Rhodobacteraceae bacterium M382]